MVRRAHAKRPVEEQEPVASIWDAQTFAIVGIFGLLLFWVAYFARDILVPITFAFVLNLLLQPAARSLNRLGLPKPLAALFTLLIFMALLLLLGASLAGPLSAWLAKAPESLPRLEAPAKSSSELPSPSPETLRQSRWPGRGSATFSLPTRAPS